MFWNKDKEPLKRVSDIVLSEQKFAGKLVHVILFHEKYYISLEDLKNDKKA